MTVTSTSSTVFQSEANWKPRICAAHISSFRTRGSASFENWLIESSQSHWCLTPASFHTGPALLVK
jgi:hypothetical protein